jgi:hypothetical protein
MFSFFISHFYFLLPTFYFLLSQKAPCSTGYRQLMILPCKSS